MPNKLRYALPLCLALVLPGASLAEMDPEMGSQEEVTHVGSMPSRGMTMDQVKQHFGQPARRHESVGEPPIIRWQYDGMMVYFERNYVIHAVATNDNDK
jgi:hypothetical protein